MTTQMYITFDNSDMNEREYGLGSMLIPVSDKESAERELKAGHESDDWKIDEVVEAGCYGDAWLKVVKSLDPLEVARRHGYVGDESGLILRTEHPGNSHHIWVDVYAPVYVGVLRVED